jgi:imidazolonepropionase-like amidohydrolase
MEALMTVTYNPARYLGLLDSLGTVEQGKTADLVLLEANPLDDISNTQRINAVIMNGRYLPRKNYKGCSPILKLPQTGDRVN